MEMLEGILFVAWNIPSTLVVLSLRARSFDQMIVASTFAKCPSLVDS